MVWISLSILVSFLVWHCYMDGVPDSISSMVYELKHKWVWSVWLGAVSLTLMPVLIDTLPDYVRFVDYMTLLLIFCVMDFAITEPYGLCDHVMRRTRRFLFEYLIV